MVLLVISITLLNITKNISIWIKSRSMYIIYKRSFTGKKSNLEHARKSHGIECCRFDADLLECFSCHALLWASSPFFLLQVVGDILVGDHLDTCILSTSSRFLLINAIFDPHIQSCSCFLSIFQQVSWIRKRDLHILTAGILTYTSDERFQVSIQHSLNPSIIHAHKY